MKVSIIAVFLLAVPLAPSRAQVKAPTNIAVPSASSSKIIAPSSIVALDGTVTSSAPAFLGVQCGGGCVIATASPGGKPSVTLNVKSMGPRATEFRTGLLVSHDVAHSVDLSLNGADIVGLLCNGHGELKVAPHYAALGASNQGFSWAIFDGGKFLKSGHSSGEAVSHGTGGGEGHSAMGPMELAVSDHGVIEIVHGGQRIVITPDDKAAIGAKTKGYLSFEDLGLRVAGPSSFALVKPALKFGVQPPGV